MKKILTIALSFVLLFNILPAMTFAAPVADDVIILYENDVHCVVEGYSKLAAMKNELKQSYSHVGVVSCGDYIRGNSLGSVSQGEYIINLMNLVGYDALTLGNHEFGYRLPRLDELVALMDTKPICCNFQRLGEDESYFSPYSIISYGDVDIAYVGITTPSTITMSFPAQFKDENGDFLYTFHPTDLYEIVQAQIDSARTAGADYVIGLSHIGYADDTQYGDLEDVETLIQNTEGFDVVLDGHSHSVIEGITLADKSGNEVLLSSTGTQFEYIGKLTISGDEFKTELIKTEDYPKTDSDVDAYIQKIYAEYSALGERKVAFSHVDLVTQDKDGNRLVRKAETNLGDLCAEAFRSAVDADIGYINGGGIRADIPAGDVTFNHLLSVLPFSNTVVMAEVDGQTIKDMMEMAMMSWPEENGSFPHLSGLTFSVNTSIPSSVRLDEQEEFAGVTGPYRVYDLKVFNRKSGKYEPLKLNGKYTLASHNYALHEQGSGMTMLAKAEILRDDGQLDVEALEQCIVDDLNGVINMDYANVAANISFTDGEAGTFNIPDYVLWIICISLFIIAILLIVFLIKRKQKTNSQI